MNLYDTLGVKPEASMEEIRMAYRLLANRTHPDVAGEAMTPLFMTVRHAYEVLHDPSRRREYDQLLGYATNDSPPESEPTQKKADSEPRRAEVLAEGSGHDVGHAPAATRQGDGGPSTVGGGLSPMRRSYDLAVAAVAGFIAGCVVGVVGALVFGLFLTILFGGEVGGLVSMCIGLTAPIVGAWIAASFAYRKDAKTK